MNEPLNTPLVSVVMSVYNGQTYLDQAIKSILAQSFTDFEFIIINDGSSDKSQDIIDGYNDPRIRSFSHENKGLAAALIEGVGYAKGQYIARQDADDYSAPTRLQVLVDELIKYPKLSIVGTARQNIDSAGKKLDIVLPPLGDNDIRLHMYEGNSFCHGSVIFNKAIYSKVGGYQEGTVPAEDYHLWLRMLAVGKGLNIADPLYCYRVNPEGITQSSPTERLAIEAKIKNSIIDKPWMLLKGTRQDRTFLLRIAKQALKRGNIVAAAYVGRLMLSPRKDTYL